jgi:DNA-binding HxlR family transcriptional regulator
MWYRYLMETILRWDALKANCPTRQVIGRIADKWTLLVITALEGEEAVRFSELRRRIEGVSQKMLTQTLRALERDGLVTRTVYPTVPITVEYRLTPLGQSLTDAVDAIRDWAYGHMAEIEAAREEFEARSAERHEHAQSPA